ncbi:YcxB family protein [Lutibacter sp. B2]|nr:YcxB family protein [Lutibacter sp. B2]
MKITYKLTKDDIQNYFKYLCSNERELKLQRNMGFICAFLTAPLMFFLVHSLILAIITATLSLLVICCIRNFSSKRIISRRIKNNPGMLDERNIEIREEGISITTKSENNLYKWTGLYSIKRTDEYLFIFFDPMKGTPIPIRSFQSEDEAIEFYNTVTLLSKKETQK